MMICIILNIIIMGMYYEDADLNYINFLENCNLAFTIIFILEMIFKLFALGLRGYFYFTWNKFDAFIVLSSLIDIIMSLLGNS